MGRSVDYLSNALHKTFLHEILSTSVLCIHCGSEDTGELQDETEDGHNHCCNKCNKTFEGYPPDPETEWSFFEDSLTKLLQETCPSLHILNRKNRRWDGRETAIIAENKLCEIGISEYCGLVSVSIRVIQDNYSYRYEALAVRWINQMWPIIQSKLNEVYGSKVLRKIGAFSNGEGIYENNC